MTLEEFIKELHARVDAFAADFRKNQKENPDYYPENMEPGQWDEQFQIFEEDSDD